MIRMTFIHLQLQNANDSQPLASQCNINTTCVLKLYLFLGHHPGQDLSQGQFHRGAPRPGHLFEWRLSQPHIQDETWTIAGRENDHQRETEKEKERDQGMCVRDN